MLACPSVSLRVAELQKKQIGLGSIECLGGGGGHSGPDRLNQPRGWLNAKFTFKVLTVSHKVKKPK